MAAAMSLSTHFSHLPRANVCHLFFFQFIDFHIKPSECKTLKLNLKTIQWGAGAEMEFAFYEGNKTYT